MRPDKHYLLLFSGSVVALSALLLWQREPQRDSRSQTGSSPDALRHKSARAPASNPRALLPPFVHPVGSAGPAGPEAAPDTDTRDRPATYGRDIDPYQGLPILAQEDTLADREGRFTRLRLVKTGMKYPFVRVEEQRQRDPNTGDERLLSRLSMVADHVMLRLEPGYTQQDLEQLASQLGMGIRKAGNGSRIFLLSFDAKDVHALERSIATLKNTRVVGAPEPDYIVRAN